MTVVAIHQPNFFPWLGYFDKIARSDAFVFLDHVQFPKTGGTWTNRMKLLVNGKARWITASIVRNYHGVLAINEMEFHPSDKWREKMRGTISENYREAPFFQQMMDFFEPLILNPENNISAYNTQAILSIAAHLGIPQSKFTWSSVLPYQGFANEMLISLTQAVGGTAYLCGGGAGGYQENALFGKHGINLVFQNFMHSVYEQSSGTNFSAGLSIIDALMNCGWQRVRAMLGCPHEVTNEIK